MSMNRYYVEFATGQGFAVGHFAHATGQGVAVGHYLYAYAYSEEHVRDIFDDYELIAVDQTD